MTQPDLFTSEADIRKAQEREGRRRKREGRDRVASNNHVFLACCRDYAQRHAITHGSVTCEDVRRWAEANGLQPSSPNGWGAIFRGPCWRVIDYVTNAIPSTHARRIAVWSYHQPIGDTP